MLKKSGISNYIHLPTSRNKETEFCEQLFIACKELHHLLTHLQDQKVLVICSSGVVKSPSVSVLYLCMFIKIECWRNPHEVDDYLSYFHPSSCPSIQSVQQVLSFYHDFQMEQLHQSESLQKTRESKLINKQKFEEEKSKQ
jgi:hypothetical protein